MKPIGADAWVRYKEETEGHFEYFSFGKWQDDALTDEFGVPDWYVFFYAEGEEEIKRMTDENNSDYEFVVMDYSLKMGEQK